MQPLALAALSTRPAPRSADRIEVLPPRQTDQEAGRGRTRTGSPDLIEILEARPAERDTARGRARQGPADRPEFLRQRLTRPEMARLLDQEGFDDREFRRERMAARRQGPDIPAGFMAQFLSQRDPGTTAHLEDWRGARGAYARADRLSASGPRGLSIIL